MIYGYTRVSTQQQVDNGDSLEVQAKKVRSYALSQGWEGVDELFCDEAVSGSVPVGARPQGLRMLSVLQEGDTIICSKLDRLFRSSLDALQTAAKLKEMKVSLYLMDLGGDVTGNGIAHLFFTMVSAFAQFERERIAERIRDVKEGQKVKGRYLGGIIPYGYTVEDGQLIPNAEQQQKKELIMTLHSQGLSSRAIAAQLGEYEGFYRTVLRIIKRDLKDSKEE